MLNKHFSLKICMLNCDWKKNKKCKYSSTQIFIVFITYCMQFNHFKRIPGLGEWGYIANRKIFLERNLVERPWFRQYFWLPSFKNYVHPMRAEFKVCRCIQISIVNKKNPELSLFLQRYIIYTNVCVSLYDNIFVYMSITSIFKIFHRCLVHIFDTCSLLFFIPKHLKF